MNQKVKYKSGQIHIKLSHPITLKWQDWSCLFPFPPNGLSKLFFQSGLDFFSQKEINSFAGNNNTWISKQYNLNITMSLNPETPLIDQKTKILFEVKNLNESGLLENPNAKVTTTDHDSRTLRFNNQHVNNEKFFVEHMFPDHGEYSQYYNSIMMD